MASPPPIQEPADTQRWLDWFLQIDREIEDAGTGAEWSNIDFTGSNITDLVNKAHNNLDSIQGGSSTERYHLTQAQHAAVLFKQTVDNTAVGNVGAGEDDLITYTLPANSLAANGAGVRITAWGTSSNNANAKTLKLKFGAQELTSDALTANQASNWRITATVWRTAATAQDWESVFLQDGSTVLNDLANGTSTEDETGTIIIKCTGTGTSNNDIVQEGLFIELIQ